MSAVCKRVGKGSDRLRAVDGDWPVTTCNTMGKTLDSLWGPLDSAAATRRDPSESPQSDPHQGDLRTKHALAVWARVGDVLNPPATLRILRVLVGVVGRPLRVAGPLGGEELARIRPRAGERRGRAHHDVIRQRCGVESRPEPEVLVEPDSPIRSAV